MARLIFFGFLFVLVAAGPLRVTRAGESVSIPAADGRTLVGSHEGSGERAVLLLHQLYTTRQSWAEVTPALVEAGYQVLAVDLRGYGETKGRIDWAAAQDDTQAWIAWLTGERGATGVFVMGSSMGANLAYVGCAAADSCLGAVGIAPNLNYFGVRTGDALADGVPLLMIYAENDRYPRRDAARMAELGGERLTTWVYPGRAHGMDVLAAEAGLLGEIIGWLAGR